MINIKNFAMDITAQEVGDNLHNALKKNYGNVTFFPMMMRSGTQSRPATGWYTSSHPDGRPLCYEYCFDDIIIQFSIDEKECCTLDIYKITIVSPTINTTKLLYSKENMKICEVQCEINGIQRKLYDVRK